LHAAGDFTLLYSGNTASDYAVWDGANWSGVGVSPVPAIFSIALFNGSIIIGGSSSAQGIYLYSGNKWLLVDNLLDNPIQDIEIWNSKVFVGGEFDKAGLFPAGKVAYWDGDWHPMQGGLSSSNPAATTEVLAIKSSVDAVYVGGYFNFAGTTPANFIARWDGVDWSSLGSGLNERVSSIETDGSNVYAGGSFTDAGGQPASHIAKWNGTSWETLGSGLKSDVKAIKIINGELYAGGTFNVNNPVPGRGFAKWDGNNWISVGGFNYGVVNDIEEYQGEIYVCGDMDPWNSASDRGIARWDGVQWKDVGGGFSGGYLGYPEVLDMVVSGGYLFAGGIFFNAGNLPIPFLARWDGTTWSSVGNELDSVPDALAADGSTLYVGGNFYKAGGISSKYFAIWHGLMLEFLPFVTR
jgi:trimeric autotransporter adhesin